jgi:hypothetical protein
MMADDEDIPANFLEEDNDLPEDEHLRKMSLFTSAASCSMH